MTLEDKILLTKDLFGRALSGVKVNYKGDVYTLGYNMYLSDGDVAFESYPMKYFLEGVEEVRPYLRPMSSMTAEEKETYERLKKLLVCKVIAADKGLYDVSYCVDIDEDSHEVFDWLNENHFDYRGLIEKGLAIEVTEDNNPYV